MSRTIWKQAPVPLALCALALAPAAQARYTPEAGILSPRLAELARPAVRSLAPPRQADAVGLPAEGPGSLEREGRRVLAEVRFAGAIDAGRLRALRAAGARIVIASHRYRTVTVAIAPGALSRLDEVAGAKAAGEVLAPSLSAAPCAGAVISEGDAQLGAAQARTDFGLDGTGVEAGILSDSFATATGTATSAAGDVLSGDLPGKANPCGNTKPVAVLSDYFPGPTQEEATDEGRAMAQVVHDLAPGASIDFATAAGGELVLAQHIKELAAAGASVIVDDVSYFTEPFFQDGPVAVAIDEVTAQGVTYLTSAGNDNLEDSGGREIASWETPEFRDSTGCPAVLEATPAEPNHCLDFNPAPATEDKTFGIVVEPEEELTIDIQWAEPWFGVKADLDAYLLDSSGSVIPLEGGASDSIAKKKPVEVINWENTKPTAQEVRLAIDRCFSTEEEAKEMKGCNPFADASAMPRLKLVLAENGSGVEATEYPESKAEDVVGPAAYGHAGAPSAITVGAVPFDESDEAEPYSSRGPVTHYFGPVLGESPAPALGSPLTIPKPDVAATDCGRTTFFVSSEPGIFRFCGTSASAPHAAAVVALAQQADSSASPAQIRAGLVSTARPVGSFGPEVVGAGLIDAYRAIDEIALPPKISFVEPRATTNDSTPSIAFTANRPVTFSCSLDGAPMAPCASPFTPEEPLGDGGHSLLVRGIDLSGRLGTRELAFVVDTIAPRTFFITHPRKTLRTHSRRARAAFRFGSDDETAQFICRVDGGLFHFCAPALSRRFGTGFHVVRVKAFDAAGNVDLTEAAYRFRVRRVGS